MAVAGCLGWCTDVKGHSRTGRYLRWKQEQGHALGTVILLLQNRIARNSLAAQTFLLQIPLAAAAEAGAAAPLANASKENASLNTVAALYLVGHWYSTAAL